MSHQSKFTNIMGTYLLQGLFFEKTLADKSSVLYTLKDRDHEGFPSLYRLYMEANDPTEYKFIKDHTGGLEHWEKLCQCEWFKPFIERWRRELELKLKSESLARIQAASKSGGRDAYQASKFLVEKGWEPKEGQTKRGRPTKDEINKAAKEQATNIVRLNEDAERLGIKFN